MTRLAMFLFAVSTPFLAMPDEPLAETRCIATTFDQAHPNDVRTLELPGFNVLSETAISDVFSLPPGLPDNIIQIMCGRSSPIFGPNDYKVVLAGLNFYITSTAPAAERRTVGLFFADGRFSIMTTQGRLSEEEDRAMQSRLREFQAAVERNEPSGSNRVMQNRRIS